MRWFSICIFVLALAVLFGSGASAIEESDVNSSVVLTVRLDNEAITPVTARHILRAIEQAERQQAACLVIILDTPGGLVDATRDIVRGILHSRVPVAVYVAPVGARAASAGVFITMAGHIAAMAPGTNIGAAHPVQIGGLPGSPPQQPAERRVEGEKEDGKDTTRAATPMEDKIVNDTVAWARSLAELRGRNAEWAARTVRESISAPASEALREGAVDLIAEDINDLLNKINGRAVKLLQGEVTLQVAGADIHSHEMWWGERLLAVLANPNLAVLLLLFGFYGIIFEFYTPGWGVSGTAGVVCLMLGFFALAVLPINYVGLALIVTALALFVAEAFVPSFGLLTTGGVVCLILGGLMLVDSPPGFIRVSPWVLVPVALATAAITFFLMGAIVKAHRAPLQTGSETLSGMHGTAVEDFSPDGDRYRGLVRTHGELWGAVSRTPIAADQKVEVEGRDGLTLSVRTPASPPGAVIPINQEQRRNIA